MLGEVDKHVVSVNKNPWWMGDFRTVTCLKRSPYTNVNGCAVSLH